MPAAARLTSDLTVDEQNPWPGLSAFDEAAQRFFNGRRQESAALRRLVTQAPLTVLFAASGLGKTSLVRAGLFPLLRKDTLPVYVRLDPREKESPLIDQVRSALQKEIRERGVDAPEFRATESLWEYLHRAGLEFWSEENQLLTPLLVFDQFEEMFTLGAANAAAVACLRTDLADLIENRMPASLAARLDETGRAVAGLSADNQRYKVLLSFREDFLAQIEGWKRDIPSIMRNRLRMLPMSADQAFEAVNTTAPQLAPEPIARRIVSFVAAAGEGPGESSADLEVAPALLSLVCHGLNERRKQQGKLVFDEAQLTGTGQEIVADFYRKAVAGLGAPVQPFIERELITERGFRKPCDVDDARTVHGIADRDLALLVDRRVLRIEPARGTERVELTHDLLTRVVREQRDQRRDRERRLKDRRRLVTLASVALGIVVVTLAGLYGFTEQRHRRTEEDRQRAVETEVQAKVRNALQAQATAATREAVSARQGAEKEAREGLSHRLAGAAISAQDPGTGILFALNALAVTEDVDHTVLPDAEEALRLTVDAMHRKADAETVRLNRPGHSADISHIVVSPDGSRVATRAEDGVRIWDLGQRDEILSLPACSILEFSRDGKRLACGHEGLGDFLDLETGKNLLPQVGYNRRARRTGAPTVYDLRQLGFSPDGKLMLWGDQEETNVEDGTSPSKKFPGRNAVVSPDGKLLATIVGKAAKVWDIGSGAEFKALEGGADRAVFSGDGRRLVVAAGPGDHAIQLWDLSSGRSTPLDVNAESDSSCLALNQDGTRLLVSGRVPRGAPSRRVGIVDISQATSPFRASSSSPDAAGCRFSDDGKSVVVDDPEGVALGWELSAPDFTVVRRVTASGRSASIEDPVATTTITLPAQDSQLQAVAFSPDATRVVTSGNDSRARVWDTASGRRLLTLMGESPIYTVAYSPDGNRIATAGIGRITKLWDAHTGQLLRELDNQNDRTLAVAFSPDGKRMLTAGNGDAAVWGTASLPDFTTRTQAGPHEVFAGAFSRDGKRLALVGTKLSILETALFRITFQAPGLNTSIGAAAISPDGRTLAVADSGGVHLWRQDSGWRHLSGSVGGGRATQVVIEFSRDGKRLLTPGAANSVRIWDTETATEAASVYYKNAENAEVKSKGVTFSPDQKQIYAIGENWTVYRFAAPLADVNAEARKLVIDAKAALTDEDCGKYLHQPVCPPQVRSLPVGAPARE